MLNKVFAVIIKLHIKVQNHLVLEVTENCYHLMALWAELSQTTLHARRNKDPVSGHCPGTHPGSGQHSDCWFPIVASWVLNLTVMLLWPWSVGVIPTWVSLAAILVSLEFSDLWSTYLSWDDQRGHDKSWVQLCNSHHGKSISKPGFLGREKEKKRKRLVRLSGMSQLSFVVLKGKLSLILTVLHFHLHWHMKLIWEQKEKFYMAHFKHLASGKNLTVSETKTSFLASTPESFIST